LPKQRVASATAEDADIYSPLITLSPTKIFFGT